MCGLLDALGEERAIFVGHDWGADVVWQLAVLHPERVSAVAGLSVPFVAARAGRADPDHAPRTSARTSTSSGSRSRASPTRRLAPTCAAR